MTVYRGFDGTELACHIRGEGIPLVCLPGGPMRDSAYLGDLGGLSRLRRLVLADLRGTGQSAVPADPAAYRCDRQVEDVAALQDHLGLDRMDLLAHSAGTNLAVLYAARYPERVGKLVLLTPSPFAVGLEVTAPMRLDSLWRRAGEPGVAEAIAAFERVQLDGGAAEDWAAIVPFTFGRWDAAAQALQAANDEQINAEAAAVYAGPDAFDSGATRAALADFDSPVLLLAGEVDLNTPPPVATEFAALFRQATLVIQPGTAHYPWLDNAPAFLSALAAFLAEGR
jgi:pimeloyl-ACP methyl ester carboxylesterase